MPKTTMTITLFEPNDAIPLFPNFCRNDDGTTTYHINIKESDQRDVLIRSLQPSGSGRFFRAQPNSLHQYTIAGIKSNVDESPNLKPSGIKNNEQQIHRLESRRKSVKGYLLPLNRLLWNMQRKIIDAKSKENDESQTAASSTGCR